MSKSRHRYCSESYPQVSYILGTFRSACNGLSVQKIQLYKCIRLIGVNKSAYHATETQLEAVKSQLLYVLSSGNWDASFEICGNKEVNICHNNYKPVQDLHANPLRSLEHALSAKGSRPNGRSCAKYSNISRPGGLLISLSSIADPIKSLFLSESLLWLAAFFGFCKFQAPW